MSAHAFLNYTSSHTRSLAPYIICRFIIQGLKNNKKMQSPDYAQLTMT